MAGLEKHHKNAVAAIKVLPGVHIDVLHRVSVAVVLQASTDQAGIQRARCETTELKIRKETVRACRVGLAQIGCRGEAAVTADIEAKTCRIRLVEVQAMNVRVEVRGTPEHLPVVIPGLPGQSVCADTDRDEVRI